MTKPLSVEERLRLRVAIDQLKKEFPTQVDIDAEVFRLSIKGKSCNCCKGSKFSRIIGDERLASCEDCGNVIYYTAGTLFEDIRILKTPLFTLYLADRGIAYNANKIHEMLGVAYDTAHKVCLKVNCMSLQEMLNAGAKFAETVSLQFNEVLNRRSRETDARQHPNTEREKELKQFVATASGTALVRPHIQKIFGTTDATNLYEDEQDIYDFLANGPASIENIAKSNSMSVDSTSISLMTLIVCGLVNKLPGDEYERAVNTKCHLFGSPKNNPQLYQAVNTSLNFISKVFDGVSRRYLQLYLAATWCTVWRTNFGDQRILDQCAKENQFLKNLKTYVSPLVVKICPV